MASQAARTVGPVRLRAAHSLGVCAAAALMGGVALALAPHLPFGVTISLAALFCLALVSLTGLLPVRRLRRRLTAM